jgi:hypothetical protein
MSGIVIPSNGLDARVRDLGVLVGLLRQSTPGGDLTLNTDWFKNPGSYIKNIPADRDGVLNLLRDFLGSVAEGTPDDREWYALDWNGAPSGVYVVLPLKSDESSRATVGLGLWHPFTDAASPLEITASAYFPLFELPLATPVVVTGAAGYPVRIALDIKDAKNKFKASGVVFDGFEFAGDVYFADAVPAFTLAFLDMQPPSPQSTAQTLKDLQGASVKEWVNNVLGAQQVADWLGTKIPSTGKKIGEVLADLKLLTLNGKTYALGGLSEFEGKTPAEVAEELFGEALAIMASRDNPVVALGDGGIYVVGEPVGDSQTMTDYGLRLQVTDIQVLGAKANSGGGAAGDASGADAPAASPRLALQLGKWLTGEVDKDNWARRADPETEAGAPGVTLLLARVDKSAADQFSFRPKLSLVSLGLDFDGGKDKPLVDVSGFKLGGFEPRFSLALDFADLNVIPWGASLRFDNLGMPLGAGVPGGGASDNPVAQNLLSSGSGDSGGGGGGQTGEGAGADKEAINPTFSAAVAKMFDPANSTSVNFQLYAPDDTPADKVWIPVQRAFGPLQCQRLGVGWPQPNDDLLLSLLFDGGVKLGGLEVDLLGLSVGIPLDAPGALDQYELGLDGLNISFTGGPVEISGGLLKEHVTVGGQDVVEYNGEALIKAATWTIAALGSWASFEGHPSLFVFAFLNAPIGGPAFFFVTGLSAGFGYNRSLTLPAPDAVQDFPFVAGLTDPSKIGGADAGPREALAALGTLVQPAQGVNWIAAGVQFTSFELINSNALVVVEFGEHFEIALLGLSRIRLPQSGPVTYAYVELGLEVIIDPSDGLFSATAMITPNSYVIDPACHLTGGFAFFIWFGDNPHAGDFVLTVGGYHPLFKKPDHYPDEPRLGFNWQVSDQVTIKGGAYFALTPSCVMGGGDLDVQFHSGDLAAWFTAHADFLIQWHPFQFVASVGVSVGVSYRVRLLFVTTTIKVELGADLELWGPPTGGRVHIHLWIVSFTVSFGPEQGAGGGYLGWDDFRQLLPQDDKPKQQQVRQTTPPSRAAFALSDAAREEAVATADAPPPTLLGNVCKINVNDGLLPRQNQPDRWLVRSDHFEFTVSTAFPLTRLDLDGTTKTQLAPPTLDPAGANPPACARADGYYVGVRGMGIACVDSVLTLGVTDVSEQTPLKLDLDKDWFWELKTQAVPEALWGQPVPVGDAPKPEANTLPGRLVGIGKVAPRINVPTGPDAIPLANLSYDEVNEGDENYLPFPRPAETNAPRPSATSLQTIADTIALAAPPGKPAANRAAIHAALAAFGYGAGTDGDMSALAASVDLNYPAPPMLGSPFGG